MLRVFKLESCDLLLFDYAGRASRPPKSFGRNLDVFQKKVFPLRIQTSEKELRETPVVWTVGRPIRRLFY